MIAGRPVLVTGANGFVGEWLVEDLLRDGVEVHGVGAVGPDGPPERMRAFRRDSIAGKGGAAYAGETGRWTFRAMDLRDAAAVADLIATLRPATIYHLAAQSSAGASFENPGATLDVNVGGTLNLLEAVRALPPEDRPRVVSAGSAEEYGPPPTDAPLHENSRTAPVSPYGVSKVAQTLLCVQAHRAWGLDVVPVRPFSHTGPGHGPAFVFPSFARRLVAIERGEAPPVLEVGNLEPLRDYLHVADVVRAYRLLAERAPAGRIVNVCSGRGLRIQSGLDILLAGTDARVEVRTDAARFRPADVPRLIGDGTRLRSLTGWRPERSVEEALTGLLAWYREYRT